MSEVPLYVTLRPGPCPCRAGSCPVPCSTHTPAVEDLGFRVWGFGVGDQGSGLSVSGLRFGGWGLWFMVCGFGFRVSGFGVRGSGFGVRVYG